MAISIVHVCVRNYLCTYSYHIHIMYHATYCMPMIREYIEYIYPLVCVFFKMETSVFHGNIVLSFLRWLEQSWCAEKISFRKPTVCRFAPEKKNFPN